MNSCVVWALRRAGRVLQAALIAAALVVIMGWVLPP